jgi:hypothetical protein
VADQTGDNGNGNRTADRLARIETKLDFLVGQMAAMSDYPAVKQQLTDHACEIDKLRQRDTMASIVAAVVSALGAFFGWLIGARS